MARRSHACVYMHTCDAMHRQHAAGPRLLPALSSAEARPRASAVRSAGLLTSAELTRHGDREHGRITEPVFTAARRSSLQYPYIKDLQVIDKWVRAGGLLQRGALSKSAE